MARTHDDIERYIVTSGIDYEEAAPGMWLLHHLEWGGAQIIIQHTDPLLVFRCKLFELPKLSTEREAALFRRLLQLNATDLVQGAYAIEDQSVVVVGVLQSISLDENEFMAAIDSVTMAIVEHHDELIKLLPNVA